MTFWHSAIIRLKYDLDTVVKDVSQHKLVRIAKASSNRGTQKFILDGPTGGTSQRRSRKTSKEEGSRRDWEAEATPKHKTNIKTFEMIYSSQSEPGPLAFLSAIPFLL